MCFGSVLWCFQVVMAAVPAPMAGLDGRNGDNTGPTGKQAGPVEALGRADTAAGRRRGGKLSERPLGSGAALLVAEMAAVEMLGCGRLQWANGKCFYV